MSYFTRPFFALVELFWNVLPLVVVIDLIAIFLLIFKEKMDPRSFAFWIVLIIVFPFIGFALYLVYGCTLYSISIFGRKFGRDREMGIMDDPRIRGADIPTEGNDGRFYGSLSLALRDIVTDLSKAEKSAYIEIYRLPEEDIAPFVDVVCEKASQGLDIRVLMGRGLPRTLMHLKRMRGAGVKFRTFHRRFFALVATTFRFRNRRVMLVIDGKVAYTGNHSVLRTAGPVASRLGARFMADWAFAVGRKPEQVPVAEPAGDITMQVVSSGPDLGEDLDPSMAEYVSLVKAAKRSIVLSEPYLVPDENVYNFLKLSALSGMEVKVIVPVRGIRWYQRWNSASAAASLVDSGVKVYMCLDRFPESLMVVDGRECGLGMAPFNGRAMLQDFHTSIVASSEGLSSQVMARMEELMSHSNELGVGDYGKRTFSQKVKIALSRFMMLFNRGERG